MRSVELFAGAGGLAMGMSNVGFEHSAVVEWNKDACETIRENQRLGVPQVEDWRVEEADAKKFDYSPLIDHDNIEVVAGGPPCQPFSMGGNHKGHLDPRDMFPEAIRAVRELKPKAFIFENVKGLLRQSFADYFEYICLHLSYPELTIKKDETWIEHLERLEKRHTSGRKRKNELKYNVVFRLLNAADYGVPQKRERVFIVGFRSDLGKEWAFPHPTHSHDALLVDQWVTGNYWKRHSMTPPEGGPPKRYVNKVARLRQRGIEEELLPWVTVRDAIGSMPDPVKKANVDFNNHKYIPGARVYPGHTGSPLDEPAKTLKAGAHGVPGGENMIAYPDGSVRYFTVREAARLQTFPDNYIFSGAWGEVMRQLGNAVPVKLGEVVAQSVLDVLEQDL